MPAYRFQAADASGVLHRGIVDADSSRQARAIIRERGQTPIEVVALSAEHNAGHINIGGRLKDADLALCTRQLSSLLTARLPLEKALNAVVEQAESAVRSDVVSGQTLTAAMAKFPRDFPDTYRALISAGEQSGDLAQVMSRLAAYVENRTQLVSKVKMAFTYPIIVAVVAILVIIALLTYVVPQVVQVFNQTRQDLPLLTLILIRTSDFIRNWGWLVLLGLGGAWAAFHYSMKAPTARLNFHKKLLGMPMFGRLIRGINAARFASTLAILTASGVPLIRALEAGADTLNNMAMKAEVREALGRVREGAPLARALGAGKTLPPLLIHMTASGEATGELPQMLERAAETLSQEVERKTLTMTTLLEPILILITGGIVLMIVLAVLLPIIEINQLVK